jgi:hypothetical protein
MLKRIHKFLRVTAAALFGNFLISTLLNFLDYRQNPETYLERSAPWYTYGALPSLGLFAGFAALSFLVGVLVELRSRKAEVPPEKQAEE